MVACQYKVLLLSQFLMIVLSAVNGEDVLNYSPEGFEPRILNPRLEHNGWKPVGQGDPLKNDPTFDYSPPALESVRYWAESNKTKEDIGKKNKTEILLLGVPSKREGMKKEHKYTSIRRSYYGGQLPTRLMPPPMQTLQSHKMKSATTEMHHYNTQYPSTKRYHSTSTPSVYRTNMPYDLKYADSNSYVTFTRPDTKYSNMRLGPNDFVGMSSHRKPWVHELLQKELIKSKTGPPKPSPTKIVKSVFETHPPSYFVATTSTPVFNPPTIATTTPRIISITTTTQNPIYPSYMSPIVSEPLYPTVAPIDITTEAPIMQKPKGHYEVSMYQIIEGHSKVKTYGQTDNETSTHEPKIVPITPRQESVIRHVTSQDDLFFTQQVRHLHNKKSTTTTTTSTTTTTTSRPSTDTSSKTATMQTQPPAKQNPSMQGLLSLLDSSIGNFFIDEPTGEEMGTLFSGPALDTEPTIFVTTTTSYPPSALELGSPRSARQVFDYDQLPESRLKDSLMQDFNDNEENDVLPEIFLRSSTKDVVAEGGNR